MNTPFYLTQMGRKFFEGDVPRMIKAVTQLTDAINAHRKVMERQTIHQDTKKVFLCYIARPYNWVKAEEIQITKDPEKATKWLGEQIDALGTKGYPVMRPESVEFAMAAIWEGKPVQVAISEKDGSFRCNLCVEMRDDVA